jgi:hypothetical protein
MKSSKNQRTSDTTPTITPELVELIRSTVTRELSHRWIPNVIVAWKERQSTESKAINLRESLIADAVAATIADLLDPIVVSKRCQSSDPNSFIIALAKRHANQLRRQATEAVTHASYKMHRPPQSDDFHDDTGDSVLLWDFIPPGRVWRAKEQVENDVIQCIENQSPAQLTRWQEIARAFYQRAVEVIGEQNVDFIVEYWSTRRNRPAADRKDSDRFYRLKKKLIKSELGPLLDGTSALVSTKA